MPSFQDSYGQLPGVYTEDTHTPEEITWGEWEGFNKHYLYDAHIEADEVDSGNTGQTTFLRAGLLMAMEDTDEAGIGTKPKVRVWDGSTGILLGPLRRGVNMGAATRDKFRAEIMMGGKIKANKIIYDQASDKSPGGWIDGDTDQATVEAALIAAVGGTNRQFILDTFWEPADVTTTTTT